MITSKEAKAQTKYHCPHVDCDDVFYNMHGMKVHAGKCKRRHYYEIEKIAEAEEGLFKVRWAGYGEEDDTWEPWHHLPPTMIKEYLLANGLYDHEWTGARCHLCDKKCKNERGIKNHLRFCYHNQQHQQDFRGRKAEGAARWKK